MSTPVGRSAGESWRVLRTPLLVTGAIVLIAIVVMIATTARTSGPFSPDSTESDGARALATLLKNHSVDVHSTEVLDDAVQAWRRQGARHRPGRVAGSL